ncbi:ABC transporter permease [bacterium]|nr:ABC transporter permease [bacterium]
MAFYLLKRFLSIIPVLLGITIITFTAIHLAPGDPIRVRMGQRYDPVIAEQLRAELGLDKPLVVQYLVFLNDLVHGDLGFSYIKGQPVTQLLGDKFGNTLYLSLSAMAIAIVLGMLAGILAAMRPQSILDYLVMILAVAGVSIPVFWLGLMLQLVFGSYFHMLPVSGMTEYGATAWENFKHLILPAVTLATVPMAIIARITRSSMLEVMGQDYIRTARAKGLGTRAIIFRHALKNALIPIITVIGNMFALLLTGAVLTETVFSWPGLGRAMVDAIGQRDFPIILGSVTLFAVTFVMVNLVVDIIYAWVDPRIRYT